MSAMTRFSSRSHLKILVMLAVYPCACLAQSKPDCAGLPDAARLRTTLQSVVRQGASKNGGMGNQEWAAVVNRDGIVCAIVFSGTTRSDQWPGSRVIAASKASTANGLSSNDLRFRRQIFSPRRNRGKASIAWLRAPLPMPRPCSATRPPSARRMIQWSARRSAESSSSEAVFPSTAAGGKSWEDWA